MTKFTGREGAADYDDIAAIRGSAMTNITEVTGTVVRVERYANSAYGNQRWRLGIQANPQDGMTWYKTGPDARFPGINPLSLEGKQVTAQVKGAVSQWVIALSIHEEGS